MDVFQKVQMTMKTEELVFTPAHQHTPGKKGQILNLTAFLLFLKKESPSSFHMDQIDDDSEYARLIHQFAASTLSLSEQCVEPPYTCISSISVSWLSRPGNMVEGQCTI